jgi:hypothetical protein
VAGPLALGIVGSVIAVVSLFVSFTYITPDRYKATQSVWTGDNPGLRRMFIAQGRVAMLAFVGATIQLVAIIWQALR